jgi:hypothetical protein
MATAWQSNDIPPLPIKYCIQTYSHQAIESKWLGTNLLSYHRPVPLLTRDQPSQMLGSAGQGYTAHMVTSGLVRVFTATSPTRVLEAMAVALLKPSITCSGEVSMHQACFQMFQPGRHKRGFV